MEIIDLPFFPFPRVVDGRRVPGYNFVWTRQCNACDRQCESAAKRGLAICSYGVNYHRISERQVIFGFLLPGASATSAQKKTIRQNPENRITSSELTRAIGLLKDAQENIDNGILSAKKEIMEIYKAEQQFKTDLLNLLNSLWFKVAIFHPSRQ